MIDFILRPVRRNFGRDKMFYRAIDDMFGFIPNNIELYKLALIHKSASVTLDNGQHINNERLEFLGDAVIESVSSDYLFIEFPDKNEGFLTQLRSKMVSRQALNSVAKRIGLDDHVITNSTNTAVQKHIYGDAFEAMMGAIYLDQGYDFVNRLLINKIFARYMKLETLLEEETDFKSRLIEWCQKNHHAIVFATSHDKSSSSAHPFFYSKVMIDNIEVGYGAGESKKEAEQRAAHSVSMGFSDSDWTKLMDKLDNIDANQRTTEPRRNDKPKAAKAKADKPAEKVVEKVVEKQPAKQVAEQSAEQPSAQSAAPTEEKPKRSRSRRSTKAKEATPTTDEKPTEENKTAKVEPIEEKPSEKKAADEKTAEEKPAEEKPKSRSRSRRRRPSQEQKEQKELSATEPTEKKPSAEPKQQEPKPEQKESEPKQE